MSLTSVEGNAGGDGRGRRMADLDAAQVAAWLQQNPEFFETHRDLLSQIRLRHPHGGQPPQQQRHLLYSALKQPPCSAHQPF